MNSEFQNHHEEEFQKQIEEIGSIYLNLTSILLNYGYEYVKEHLEEENENSEIIKWLNETMKVLDLLAPEEIKPSNLNANQEVQAIKQPRKKSPRVLRDVGPLIKIQTVPDRIEVLYERLDKKWGDILRKPSPLHLQVPKATRNVMREKLKQVMKEKIREKIESKLLASQELQGNDDQLDVSFNVEDLNLEI